MIFEFYLTPIFKSPLQWWVTDSIRVAIRKFYLRRMAQKILKQLLWAWPMVFRTPRQEKGLPREEVEEAVEE